MSTLSQVGLPRLFLDLQRDTFSGRLLLRHSAVEKCFHWQAGTPIRLESSQSREQLGRLLVERGLLEDAALSGIRRRAEGDGRKELAVLLTSRMVAPRDLLRALADQLEDALADCLAWCEGEVSMEIQEPPSGRAPGIPVDVPAALARGIAAHWRVDQVLCALGPRATQFPVPHVDFETACRTLSQSGPVRRLLEQLDGSRPAFALLGPGVPIEAAAALWLLDARGALAWSESGRATGSEPSTDAAPVPDAEAEIEIVVSRGAGDTEQTLEKPVSRAAARPEGLRDEQAEALRNEVLALHGRLGELTCYELLGVDRQAGGAEIKRAYLRAAKRLHPDALARLGQEDVKEQANELFAQIARAYRTLSNPDERRSYDASLDGHSAVDANQVAQAEALFRKGEILLKSGNFLGALEFLEAAVQIWPEEADYQAALGWALYRKNPPELGRSLEHFERALELGGESPQTLLRMSLVLRESGQSERSSQLGARARQMDPGIRA